MDNINENKFFISEFNDGFNQVQRLNSIWSKCHYYASKGDLQNYKWELDRAWVELAAGAKERDDNLSKDKQYTTKYNYHNSNIIKAGKIKSQLYYALMDKEIFLRCLAKKLGLGGKDKVRDEEDF